MANTTVKPVCEGYFLPNISKITCNTTAAPVNMTDYYWDAFECLQHSCYISNGTITNGAYVSNITEKAIEAGSFFDFTKATAVPKCESPWYSNVTSLECKHTTDNLWSTFECLKNCTVPSLANGYYLDALNSTITTNSISHNTTLKPFCNTDYAKLGGMEDLYCHKNGSLRGNATVSCKNMYTPCVIPKGTVAHGAFVSNLTGQTLEQGTFLNYTLATAVPKCESPWYPNTTTVQCNPPSSYVWTAFECLKNCTVPTISGGYYQDTQNSQNVTANSSIAPSVTIKPSCGVKYDIQNSGNLECQKNGSLTGNTASCKKKRDICSKLAATSEDTACSLDTNQDLYTCNMTCNSGYSVVIGGAVSASQIITCNYTTELWSHENVNNTDRSWSKCRKKEDPSNIVLNSVLTFSGTSSCPTTTALDTALDTWLKAQSNSAYGCYTNGSCALGDGSTCAENSGKIDYTFTVDQSKNTDVNYMTGFSAQLTTDAEAKSVNLKVASGSGRKRASEVTLTSEAITTKVTSSCANGYQLVNSACIACEAGNYGANNTCHTCTQGTYSSSAGSSDCTSCSGNTTTLGTGSASASDCVEVCTVPTIDSGITNPSEGSTTSTKQSVTVTCDNEYDVGYGNNSIVTCKLPYQCYEQCKLPTVTGLQSYTNSSLSGGDMVSYGRSVSVKCGKEVSVMLCNGTSTLAVPACKAGISTTNVKDIKSGSEATLSCTISTIDKQVEIEFYVEKDVGDVKISNGAIFAIDQGSFSNLQQTATLKVSPSGTDSDKTFKCKAPSVSVESALSLDVFSISTTSALQVPSGTPATLACTISGASKLLAVSWEHNSAVVTNNDQVTVTQGNYESGSQVGQLTVTSATQDATYHCLVAAADGSVHKKPVTLTVKVPDPDPVDPDPVEPSSSTHTTFSLPLILLALFFYSLATSTHLSQCVSSTHHRDNESTTDYSHKQLHSNHISTTLTFNYFNDQFEI